MRPNAPILELRLAKWVSTNTCCAVLRGQRTQAAKRTHRMGEKTNAPNDESMQTEKVHFTKEKETMLITVYARSLESRSKDPVLQDPWAEEAINRIDYDFEKLKRYRPTASRSADPSVS